MIFHSLGNIITKGVLEWIKIETWIVYKFAPYKSTFWHIIILFWLVYDGKWCSGPCTHSHWCHQVLVLQSCGWKLCLQQGKGWIPLPHESALTPSYKYFHHLWRKFINYVVLQIHKVPSTDMEALKSPLMGLFEKRRAGKFFLYVQDYKENDPSTHKGYDLTKLTTKQLISWVPILLPCLGTLFIYYTMQFSICLHNFYFVFHTCLFYIVPPDISCSVYNTTSSEPGNSYVKPWYFYK